MVKVIGSGFGRTGTLSMKAALEKLGLGPCYHMEELLKRPAHIRAWHDLAHGKPVDWQTLFRGFQATVDFPASIVYKELMAAFPEAKVIHTIRDPERWYDSTYETIYQAERVFPRWLQIVVKSIGRFVDMQERLIWQHLFEGSFENRQRAIEIFEQYTADVKRMVPADRLLIFQAKEGWEPLCRFLEVPVPDTPFPHANDRSVLLRRFRIMRLVWHWGPVVVAGLIAVGLYWLWSQGG
ncbi:MAG TPA: sulfotransferase [Anaerolineae bacterium]|jgi:hypothetical protein